MSRVFEFDEQFAAKFSPLSKASAALRYLNLTKKSFCDPFVFLLASFVDIILSIVEQRQ